MREIRFRAWHKPLGKMIEPDRLEHINFEVKVLGVYIKMEDRGFHKLRMSDFELMQYVGLKDKAGNPIYEGDIVKYISREQTGTRVKYKRRGYDTYAEYSEIEIIGHVRLELFDSLSNGKLMTYVVDTKQVTKYESYFWGEGRRTDRPKIITNSLVKALNANKDYEIIGNIYENPELIRGD